MAISWSAAGLVKYRKTEAALAYIAAKRELDHAEREERSVRHIEDIEKMRLTSDRLGTPAEARQRARLHREKAAELIAEADRLEGQP